MPAGAVVRKKSCEWFKPVLVMETGENRFRGNPISLRNVVAGCVLRLEFLS